MNKKNENLDPKIIRELKFRIIGLVRTNLKTKKYRNYEMEEKILKLIEREVLD